MTGLGGVTRGPAEAMLTLLLTSMLLATQISATDPPPPDSGTAPTATKAGRPTTFPYRFWQKGKSSSVVPTTTSEPSSYEYYYKENEDLGTDPSTWKLLPIQIPDDLVSGASRQEDVTKASIVPTYPSSVTPLHGRHPGVTEPQPSYPPEGLHKGTASGQGSPETQLLTRNGHDSEDSHQNPEPQLHDNKAIHGLPEPQENTWEPYHPEGSHKSHELQQERWDYHDNRVSQGRHEPQREDWDQHDNRVNHGRPEPQPESWEHHGMVSHSRPEPQQNTLNRHTTDGSQSAHEPQHHTWDSHGIGDIKENPESRHPNWDRHYTNTGDGNSESRHPNRDRHYTDGIQGNPETQHQNWDRHDTVANHGTLEPGHSWERHDTSSYSTQEQHKWGHHDMQHNTQHVSSPPKHYYNRTHTVDGYEIRNYSEDDQFTRESQASNQNSEQPQRPMPNRPMAWNWKPPDTPSWHQNIVERIGHHLSMLPSLPKFRLPGLGSLPRLPRLPQWILGGLNRRIYNQEAEEVVGDYTHKFYPLVHENNPLKHLESNLDRHHSPLYKYPPRQHHTVQENTLNLDQNTDKASHHQSHNPLADGGGEKLSTDAIYKTQRPTRPQHYNAQSHGHHNTRNEPQTSHQEPHASHKTPPYTQLTRRPSQSHDSPQRVLNVPHRQAYEGHWEKHQSPSNSHKWRWETQQKHTTLPYPPQRDPLNRYPSPLHNWLPQGPTRPSSGYAPLNSTRHGQQYRPQTHPAHPQRPYNPTPNHRHPQLQYQQQQHQQQGVGSSWFSAGQHQHEPEDYDNILDPLSSLLSRPLSYSIIGSSPYEQSIMDRLTGLSTSDTTSTGLSIPGGLLVLGLALALFYFNFVWYPTPVVTAKISKMLSDNTPSGSLSEGQQQAVGEVYQVFRSLEKEYKHDPSTSSALCRSRLVCQVHQELPGLWGVTQTYAAIVKSILASGSEGDSGFSGYQTAARRGSRGEDCAAYYKECTLPIAPVKAALKKLLTLLTA